MVDAKRVLKDGLKNFPRVNYVEQARAHSVCLSILVGAKFNTFRKA